MLADVCYCDPTSDGEPEAESDGVTCQGHVTG